MLSITHLVTYRLLLNPSKLFQFKSQWFEYDDIIIMRQYLSTLKMSVQSNTDSHTVLQTLLNSHSTCESRQISGKQHAYLYIHPHILTHSHVRLTHRKELHLSSQISFVCFHTFFIHASFYFVKYPAFNASYPEIMTKALNIRLKVFPYMSKFISKHTICVSLFVFCIQSC